MTATAERPVLAYRITELGDEEHSIVLFRTSNAQARREGAGQLNTEWEGVTCARAPEFDEYIQPGKGEPEPMEYLEQGWYWECQHCSRRTSHERAEQIEEERAANWTLEEPMTPMEREGHIYCSAACWKAKKRQRRQLRKASGRARAATMQQFPGVQVLRVMALHLPAPHVIFRLPGVKGRDAELGWTVGDTTMAGSPAAREHYRAYKAARVA